MEKNLFKILPSSITSVIESRLNYDKLYELRLRAGKGVAVNYDSKYYYLTENGISQNSISAIKLTQSDIASIVVRASQHSLYAVHDQIKEGFITIAGGIRIGIAGEVVKDDETVKTIKNFSSLNIRVPHEVENCSQYIYDFCAGGDIFSTLIVSPPGCGKTTILRDLARKISNKNKIYNILLVDERNEISASYNGISQLNVGSNTDIIAHSTKEYAFRAAIRGLRPDLIICDELYGAADVLATESACACGVKIIASIHGENHGDILLKNDFNRLVKNKVFSRYVDLSDRYGVGTCDGIYDENFELIYTR